MSSGLKVFAFFRNLSRRAGLPSAHKPFLPTSPFLRGNPDELYSPACRNGLRLLLQESPVLSTLQDLSPNEIVVAC